MEYEIQLIQYLFHKLQLQTRTVLHNLDFQTHFMGTIQNISHKTNKKLHNSVQSNVAREGAVIFKKWKANN